MNQGSLGELILTRSVTKHIRKHNKALSSGTGVGDDYSSIGSGDNGIILTEGYGSLPYIAWVKAMNNFAVSGGKPLGVRLLFMLPEGITEADIKSYMSDFNGLADSENIQIMGGNTQISKSYEAPSFIVSVLGMASNYVNRSKKVEAGFDIVMTKYAGILGSNVIADSKRDDLGRRLATSYIDSGLFKVEDYSISKEAGVAAAMPDNVYYMHDVSFGGVYGALWQLGSKLNKGIKINHYNIPIRQQTIEFCEFVDVNPYMLEGTGSLLIVAKDGEALALALRENGINAEVIGVVTEKKDRLVQLGESAEKRFLAPVNGDEIYKVVSSY